MLATSRNASVIRYTISSTSGRKKKKEKEKKKAFSGWTESKNPKEQKRLVALTLMVQMCSFAPVSLDSRWLDEAPRVSALSDGLVFLSSQRLFSVVQGRFLRVRHHLTAYIHNTRLHLGLAPSPFMKEIQSYTAASYMFEKHRRVCKLWNVDVVVSIFNRRVSRPIIQADSSSLSGSSLRQTLNLISCTN